MSLVNEVVEHVYVLNLDEDIYKYNILRTKLGELGIEHERFAASKYSTAMTFEQQEESYRAAVDKYRGTDLFEQAAKRGGDNLKRCLGAYRSPGAMGCVLSNLNIFRDAKEKKYKKILILQDDIYFHNDFDELIEVHQQEIEKSMVCFLGAMEQTPHVCKVSWGNPNWCYNRNKYRPRPETYGTFAVVFDESFYDDIIEMLETQFYACDQSVAMICSTLYQKQCWVAYPNLVMADIRQSKTTLSERRKRMQLRPFAVNAGIRGWDLEFYDLSNPYWPLDKA